MRLRMLAAGWVVTACLLACGGERPEGGQCTFTPSTNDDDCAAGLFCNRPANCSGPCSGICVKSCAQDSDCASNQTCSGRTSSETGLKPFCK